LGFHLLSGDGASPESVPLRGNDSSYRLVEGCFRPDLDVESWAPGVYEVEFSDDQGRTYAMVALNVDGGLKEQQIRRF